MRTMIVRLLAAAAVFWLGFDGGSYGLESRQSAAVAVWWVLLLLVLAYGPSRLRFGPLAASALALLGGFAALTGASLAWAPSAERAFVELDRVLLYLGVVALAAVASAGRSRLPLSEGVAIGIVAVVAVAVATRCFPGLHPQPELARLLPGTENRLSYPVGYWNGLAVLGALAVPLLLAASTVRRAPWLRGLGLAPLPLAAATVYLASSRGGAVSLLLGVAVSLALIRSWAALGAALVAGTGSAAAVGVFLARPELVDRPDVGGRSGTVAAVLLLVVCCGVGVAYALGCRYLRRLPKLGARSAVAAAVVVAAVAAVGLAAAHPVQAFEEFRRPPAELAQPQPDFVRAHLLSAGGSGRWQFWAAALDELETRPLSGRGAGSYESWWAQHGSLALFVRDAHSLYLETLGELGLAGLALLLGFLAASAAVATRALRVASGAERPVAAGLAAAFATWAFAAGIDWMWELTTVSIVGLACLGFLLGGPRAGTAHDPARRGGTGFTVATVCVCAAIAAAEALPLVAETRLDASRHAAAQSRFADARAAADDARALTPWAATPYLQLALVEERVDRLATARLRIAAAIDRDPEDWRLQLIAARLATKAGAIAEARRALARARELNPRSPLLRSDTS